MGNQKSAVVCEKGSPRKVSKVELTWLCAINSNEVIATCVGDSSERVPVGIESYCQPSCEVRQLGDACHGGTPQNVDRQSSRGGRIDELEAAKRVREYCCRMASDFQLSKHEGLLRFGSARRNGGHHAGTSFQPGKGPTSSLYPVVEALSGTARRLVSSASFDMS